jgi:hypothetical protein
MPANTIFFSATPGYRSAQESAELGAQQLDALGCGRDIGGIRFATQLNNSTGQLAAELVAIPSPR